MEKELKPAVIALSTAISIIIIIGAYLYFSYEEQTIKTEKHNELKAIAELKISQIANWNKERFTDAKIFSQSPFFVNGLENWVGSKSNLSVGSEILKRLALINTDSLYSDVMITDAKGKLLLSLDPKFQQIDSTTEGFVKKAAAEKKIISTDLYRCQPDNEIHLDFIAPVIGKDNVVIAALILRVNPDNYLYPLINEWPTTSKTSETLIIKKDGDSVLYLNELSHSKNTALKFRISLSQKEVPAVQAVLGYNGIFEGMSYHGVKVLAYISPVHGTSWVMIAQEDESEIYASLYFREKVIISFTILLIVVLSVGLIWYYHYRQRNIYRELFVKEKELREYHEEFRTILYSIGDGVITTDINGSVKQMNYVAEELTGWNETEGIGKPIEEIFKIINEGTRNKVDNPVHKVLKEGVIIGLANHTLLISKDGRETPIADSGAPIRDEKGEIEGVVLVFRDKTEEHKAEKLIRQSEARLRRAELASKAGNWELNLTTQTIVASEGASKIYGVDWDEISYEVVKKVALPEYREMMDAALKNLLEKNEQYDIEFKIKTADTGKIKDIHSVAQYDKENKILFGVIQDITDRKRIETALVDSEEKMRMIVEGTPHLFFYTQDINAEVTYISPSVEKITGYTVGQWLGQKHWFVTDSEINKLAKEKTHAHLRGEFTKEPVFVEIARTNGSNILLEIYENPIIKENKVVGIHGVAHDITERIEAQNTIENSLKEKEILLKEIHHRVKNNFQRIISLIELQTQPIEDQQILEIFEDLQNRLRTMSLIHELMYSTGDYAGVDVKNYIERLTSYLVKTYSSSCNVKLNLDLENHSLDLETIIPCGLITNEIITNSLKYAFPDEAEGSINISFKKINGEFCLTFFDDGIGMKNKVNFENINSLGLRLVNLLTKQLRGTLEVVQPDKGLQFIIKFKGES